MKREIETTGGRGSSSSPESVQRPRRRRRLETNFVNSEHMEKGKKRVNFKWSQCQSNFFISFMADQARAGLKVDKGFKSSAITAAAKAVNEKFPGVIVTEANCSNHYRTLKSRWQIIKKVKDLSGSSWDETTKTVIMSDEQYRTYIEAHPNAEPYINKPIELFEELALICGDDYATGSFEKSIGEPMDQLNLSSSGSFSIDVEDMENSQSNPVPIQSGSSGRTRTSGSNRSRNNFDEYEGAFQRIVKGLEEIGAALRAADPMVFARDLYQAVKGMKQFQPSILEAAFEYLMLNKVDGQMFLIRSDAFRAAWLDRFSLDHPPNL